MFFLARYVAPIVTSSFFLGLASSAVASPSVNRTPSAALPRVELRAGSAAAAYTLDDIGAPPVSTFPSSNPVGFNNTGQIFGTALRAAKSDRFSYATDTDCLVWTGKAFVDLSPSLTTESCTPYSMNGANAKTGAVTVVGYVTDIYHPPEPPPAAQYGLAYLTNVAFSAQVSPAAGTATFVPYYDREPSALYGVNAAGTALGYSFVAYETPLFVASPPNDLTFLQPACVSPKAPNCLVPVQSLPVFSTGEPPAYCAFGGCTLDDAGNALGYDYSTKTYALVKIGTAAPPVELPQLFGHVLAMNDSGTVLFVERGDGMRRTVSAVYDRASAATTVLPPVPGTSCGDYYALSINNAGKVLGFTSDCTSRAFYWTWDAVHGTQQLSASVPAGASHFAAYGVNDAAQILVSFSAAGGTVHWGILKPAAATPTGRRPGGKGGRHGR